MIISDQQREENYQEYLRLLNDPNYYDVSFDEKSGGVSAIHHEHQFDSQTGAFGIKKGDYEIISVKTLRERGHAIILESENAPEGIMSPDGSIDGIIMDIKAIEGHGKWAIKDKLHRAAKQGAECVILYFHKREFYSSERVDDGWSKFISDKDSLQYVNTIKHIVCVVEETVLDGPI